MEQLDAKKILKFWLPLAGTWLMMSLEGPFIAAIIARLVDPKFNLAAYGVAFSFALIVEAPVIMMMTASTSLVKEYESLRKLRQFSWMLNAITTAVMLVLIIPDIFYFITLRLIGLPEHVAELTHVGIMILLPWPGAIGFRRFYQGVLISNRATRRVAYGTVVRLLSMASVALGLFLFTALPGVYIGTAALSAGVSMEAISTRIMVNPILRRMKAASLGQETVAKPLTFTYINHFYYPLALTSMLTLGVHPLVTFFIGKSQLPLESLAVLPVVSSFVFLFRGIGLSFQEAAITLMGASPENDRVVNRFATGMAILLASGLILTAVTPLSHIWFSRVSGLSPELTRLAITPLLIMGIFPASTVLISMQRAVLVKAGETGPITNATIIEVCTILLVLYLSIIHLSAVGVVAATSAFLTGRIAANIYLHFKTR